MRGPHLSARMPANTDLPDRLVLGLTAHHLLLAVPGFVVALAGAFVLTAHAAPVWAVVPVMVVVAVVTAAAVLTNPDGDPIDRFLRARRRHRRSPKAEVLADALPPLPSWAQDVERGSALSLPWRGTEASGIVVLGADGDKKDLGYAGVLRLSALDYDAMDEDAVGRAAGALDAWLATLDSPAQLFVRAEPVSLAPRIDALGDLAAAAPHPGLAATARARADQLRDLEARRPLELRAYLALRHTDRDGLAERAARAVQQLAAAGLAADPVEEAELADLLSRPCGGRARSADRPSRAAAPEGMPAPEELERVGNAQLRVGSRFCTTFRTVAYPTEVAPGWLRPLLRAGVALDLSLQVEPEPPEEALGILRRQVAHMGSTRDLQEAAGELADADVDAGATDAERLFRAVGRNETRTFQVGLYVTVWADSAGELEAAARTVEAAARGIMLDPRPAWFAAKAAWLSSLPLALDLLRRTWRMDARALALTLPVSTGEVDSDLAGALAGVQVRSGAPLFVDRFTLGGRRTNFNKLVVAPSGAGKSFALKHEVLSLALDGVEVAVVDFDNEYVRLAEAVGGTVVRLGVDGVRVNPFELTEVGPDALLEQSLFVGTLVATLVEGVSAEERAVLDRAVLACYRAAGISSDHNTFGHTPPELSDLVSALYAERAGSLAERLRPWVEGAHRGLFSGQTTVPSQAAPGAAGAPLVVYALAGLPAEEEQLVAAGVLLAIHAIWRRVARGQRRPRIVVLDEAWKIWQASEAAGRFLERLVKRLVRGARKYQCGLTNATQDFADFTSTSLGRTILNNSAIKFIPGQETQLPEMADALGLPAADRAWLASAPRGQGLLILGGQRTRVEVQATQAEHRLCTSDPAEVAAIEAAELSLAVDQALSDLFTAWSRACRSAEATGLGRVATGAALDALVADVEACRRRPREVAAEWRVTDIERGGRGGPGDAEAQIEIELARHIRALDPMTGRATGEAEARRAVAQLRLVRADAQWKLADAVGLVPLGDEALVGEGPR